MPEGQESIQKLIKQTAESLSKGIPTNSIIADFVEMGVPEDVSTRIVKEVNKYRKREFRKAGLITTGIGAGLLALGYIITAGTYAAAGRGHTYIVTTGLFVAGALTLIKGLWRTLVG
jgi:hypothetical protein